MPELLNRFEIWRKLRDIVGLKEASTTVVESDRILPVIIVNDRNNPVQTTGNFTIPRDVNAKPNVSSQPIFQPGIQISNPAGNVVLFTPAAGKDAYLTSLYVQTSIGTATALQIRDGATSVQIEFVNRATAYEPNAFVFPTPMRFVTDITFNATLTGVVRVNIVGFQDDKMD